MPNPALTWVVKFAVLYLSITLLVVNGNDDSDIPDGSISMKIKNHAGFPIEVFWIDETSRELVLQSEKPIRNSSEAEINSYHGHEFTVKFYKGPQTHQGFFTKGPKDETIHVHFDPTTGFRIKQVTKFDEMKSSINIAAKSCVGDEDNYSTCVASAIEGDLEKLSDSKDELEKYRDRMSNRLRNYTCADTTMNSTKPARETEIILGGKSYNINTLFESTHSKIWSVENFLSEEECGHLIEYGAPRLHRATVAAADGTSTVSIHRKAQQASYSIQTRPDDPLWNLYHRVLHITNNVTGFHLQPDGQEDFTIIQYNEDDQYTPHCDGNCAHDPYVPGGRVATAVMYCKVAEVGGGTSFTKADVFVKPSVGQATFFSYRGPDGLMDSGYTEHSGCPVLKGEKWITTFWMRDGVSKANPWTIYDPSGIPILDNYDLSSGGDAN